MAPTGMVLGKHLMGVISFQEKQSPLVIVNRFVITSTGFLQSFKMRFLVVRKVFLPYGRCTCFSVYFPIPLKIQALVFSLGISQPTAYSLQPTSYVLRPITYVLQLFHLMGRKDPIKI